MARMFMAGCVWHALCLKLAFADLTCGDGQEAAGLKSSSLMQVNTGHVKTLSTDTSSESLAGFSQMVLELAEKVAGHNYTLGKEESNALEVIRKWIENMNETLTIQHKEDQSEVDRVRDLIARCTSSTNTMMSNNVSGYKLKADNDRTAHTACRNKQKSGGDLKSAACVDYDKYRKGMNPYLDGAEVPPSCASKLTEDKIETSDPVTRESMETCLVGTHTWLIPLYSRYLLCHRRTQNLTNITQKCDDLQLRFEQSFCLYELKLSDTCDDHTRCRKKELGVRSDTHAQVRVSESARKADHVTGVKVLCLFDVFLADNPNKTQTLNRCRALQVDTSHFDITYPDAPGPAPCVKEPNKPCDEAWKTKEYSKLSVSVNTCTPCAKPQPPPPAKTKGCTKTGVTGFFIGDKKVNLHCEVGNDGSWALVHVSLSNANNADNLYPVKGENYPGLEADADEWASLSEADMHSLWFSTDKSVLKVSTQKGVGTYDGSLPDEHYIQRTTNDDFSPFRAIRYVPEWGSAGSGYKICSNSASCYQANTRTVTHSGRSMHHWENRYLDLANGDRITVSRHGIPGDVTRGCQWLYIFPGTHGCSNGQTAAYCNGQCHSACRNCLVVSRVYLAADDLDTAA